MCANDELKMKVKEDLRDVARLIGVLTMKYRNDPLTGEAGEAFLRLSTDIARALEIRIQ
jgi:hypothetical protein